ncbi:MAG: hypothetical protein JW755_03305 [Candidatus Aminicenantes bacterium]|nr:hypothetical protein [Candidatus Aminicenantes bacterium]
MSKKDSSQKKKRKGFDHLFAFGYLERFVEFIRSRLTDKVLDFSTDWILKFGHYGMIAAAGLGFVLALIVAIRIDSFSAFLYGLAWIVLVFVVQYTAVRFSTAGAKLVENNPASLSSKAFLDCFGFLAFIGGLIVLVVSVIWTIRGAGLSNLFIGLGIFVLLEFLALVAFHPEAASTKIVKETSAGQEALGIIVFYLKGVMKLIPIIFGIGILVGTVLLFIDFIGVFGDRFKVETAWANGINHAWQILLIGLLPFLSYLFFLLYYLAVDVVRSILAVPGKLDELKKSSK